jgi:hypothetical protein
LSGLAIEWWLKNLILSIITKLEFFALNIVKPRLHGDHEHRILNTVGTPAEISTDINMEVVVPNYSYSSAMKHEDVFILLL